MTKHNDPNETIDKLDLVIEDFPAMAMQLSGYNHTRESQQEASLYWYKVTVFSSFRSDRPYDRESDYTNQEQRIMTMPGYSHFSLDARLVKHDQYSGWGRDVMFRAKNKAKAIRDVKAALGKEYWQGFHVVYPLKFDRQES